MPSAATRIVQFAERDYRLVRDAHTKTVYGLPLDESHEPVQLEALVELCAERDFRDEGAVPAASAKRDALALLRAIHVDVIEEINRRADALSEIERLQAIDELAIECLELARSSSILAELDRELVREGFAGNTLVPRTVFLAGQSTHLDVGRNQPSERLVSVKVDGPSAAGKNYAVEAALAFLPHDFAISMTAMSERALVYDSRPIARHAFYFPEGGALEDGGLGTLILRSLLSENRIQYPTVVTDGGFPETVFIEREGPVMAVIATSAIKLDRDLETRLLHLRIDDSEKLTEEIIRRHGLRAQQGGREAPDRTEWHALFSWLRLQGPFRVRIPFAVELAELIPAKAVRLRRDVGLLMTLIGASAVLHLATRETRDGFVIATLDDYRSVRELIDTALGAGVGSTWAGETYAELPVPGDRGISFSALGRKLGIGPDAARDRALKLVDLGYVINEEARHGAPARLVQGDPLASDEGLLPALARLEHAIERTSLATRSGVSDPNVRTDEAIGAPAGNEVLVPVPEGPPEARTAADLRASVQPSGATSRTYPPHSQADPESPAEVRVDFHAVSDDGGSVSSDEESPARKNAWQKPCGTCHMCEEQVGANALVSATVHGGRLQACPSCLMRWPSIRPTVDRTRSRPASTQLDMSFEHLEGRDDH